jgi:hypothetical protein
MAAEPLNEPVLLTLPEAASWLDPPITLKTLRRAVAAAGLRPRGHRRVPIGRPAALYASDELFQVHAAWVHAQAMRQARHGGA